MLTFVQGQRDIIAIEMDYYIDSCLCHCRCMPGTFGEHCEQSSDICASADPCLNGGTCDYTGGMLKCICPLGKNNLYLFFNLIYLFFVY